MKLNKLEFCAMNNPLRAIIQEKYELKILYEMASIKKIHMALEIGCGNGYGTKLIKKYFSPTGIIGIDLDERMIYIARKRNDDSSISFEVMNASKLDFPEKYFDAIFDFGIIHHIPNWKKCLKEVKRVLKPKVAFIVEDLSIESFSMGIGNLWRILSDHPYESMYTLKQFTDFLCKIGFSINSYKEYNPLNMLKLFALSATIK